MEDNRMKLYKCPCHREGYERYHDFWLVWHYNDKVYKFRIRQVFNDNYKFLCSVAKDIDFEELKALK